MEAESLNVLECLKSLDGLDVMFLIFQVRTKFVLSTEARKPEGDKPRAETVVECPSNFTKHWPNVCTANID